ncbi:Tex family protein [Sutterella sp.]|uniref:Tex family protein n=1 Tax=Sutterella sp. TaxID=1981025 RepID=UPI0026DFBD72|nr:Tex family protein [Sutterella sp.]MDO5530382.1 Tex family protein [Sutterella sp.]
MTSMLPARISARIAQEITARPAQVEAAAALLDDGATVPFIARYRKEATGGLTDAQLRTLEERLVYLRELDDRRETVLAAIEAAGKLTDELRAQIMEADTKQALEDLYAPYKSKRRTRAAIAREAGLEPLADRILADRTVDPTEAAQAFVDAEKGFADAAAVLNGARDILAERFSLDVKIRETLRAFMANRGELVSRVVEEKRAEAEKFRDYFEFSEPLSKVPSHRALAILRGRREGFLNVAVELPPEEEQMTPHPAEARLADLVQVARTGRAADEWLLSVCRWTWRVKSRISIETDLLEEMRERAEETAIGVFGENLRDLLLAAPVGHHAVVGLDPGFRTGVKAAVIDDTGRVLAHDVLMMHTGEAAREGAKLKLARLITAHKAAFVAIGNGTASRETSAVVGEVFREHPEAKAIRVIVSEAGASVYSASELASEELPGLDVSYRGAVSIARRLQDPLAELVKIDPKAIGVGQYQHDVDHQKLERRLSAVVEDCVNFVGVDVNTASPQLLAHVAGLTRRVAQEIVNYRESHGAFRDREALKDVPYLGDARFLQAAGFLRIHRGANPLDGTGVHPESYGVVKRIVAKLGLASVKDLMGNAQLLGRLRPQDYADEKFGAPTVLDIIRELEKPERDPRAEFKTAEFKDEIQSIEDLRPGMKLEGVVANVAAFGAFVDVGVHVNGLVHVSALADHFVRDPREEVRVGQVVKVTVVEVDTARQRIALSMRSDGQAGPGAGQGRQRGQDRQGRERGDRGGRAPQQTALGAAFAKLKR